MPFSVNKLDFCSTPFGTGYSEAVCAMSINIEKFTDIPKLRIIGSPEVRFYKIKFQNRK